jgi:outer membrane protein
MKTIFLKALAVVALGLSSLYAEAQVSKGMKLLNGSIGLSRNTSNDERTAGDSKNISNSIFVSPMLGYFISDRVCVGMGLLFSNNQSKRTYETLFDSTTNENRSNSFQYGLSPFMRYYIPFSEKFYGYLQVGVGGSLTRSETKTNGLRTYETKGFSIIPEANFGLTYFVSTRLALETRLVSINYTLSQLERIDVPNDKPTTRTSSLNLNYLGSGLSLGVSYYLK